MNHWLNVVLNQNGIILSYESAIEELEYAQDEVIGKNWFDIFIEPTDKNKIFKLFMECFYRDNFLDKKPQLHTNDVITKNGHHKLIDFENEMLLSHTGEKFILVKGIEHHLHYCKCLSPTPDFLQNFEK